MVFRLGGRARAPGAVKPGPDDCFHVQQCGSVRLCRRHDCQRGDRSGESHRSGPVFHAFVPDRRARDQPALGAQLVRPDGLVIGIDQIVQRWVEVPVVRLVRPQDEGLEKPGGLSEMPFDRTGVRHRLDLLVLG